MDEPVVVINDVKSRLATLKNTTSTDEERIQTCSDICTAVCFGGEDAVRSFDVAGHGEALLLLLDVSRHVATSLVGIMAVRVLAVILDQVPRSYTALVSLGVVASLYKLVDNHALSHVPMADEVVRALTALSLDCPTGLFHKNGVRTLVEKCFETPEYVQARLLVAIHNCFAKCKQPNHAQVLSCVTLIVAALPRQVVPKTCVQLMHCLAVIVERIGTRPAALDGLLRMDVLSVPLALLAQPSMGRHRGVHEAFSAIVLAAFHWAPQQITSALLAMNAFATVSASIAHCRRQGFDEIAFPETEGLVRHWAHVLCQLMPPLTTCGVSDGGGLLDLYRHVELRAWTYQWGWEDNYHNLVAFDATTSLVIEATYKTNDHSGVYVPHIGSFASVFYFTDMLQLAIDGSVARRLHRTVAPTGTHLRTLQGRAGPQGTQCVCPPDPRDVSAAASPPSKAEPNVIDPLAADGETTCCGCFPCFGGGGKGGGATKPKPGPRVQVTHAGIVTDVLLTTATLCEDITATSVPSEGLRPVLWGDEGGRRAMFGIILPQLIADMQHTTNASLYRDGMFMVASCLEACRRCEDIVGQVDGMVRPLLTLTVRCLAYCRRRAQCLVAAPRHVASLFDHGLRATALRGRLLSALTEDGQLLVVACCVLNHLTCAITPPTLGLALHVTGAVAALRRLEASLRGIESPLGEITEGCPLHPSPGCVANSLHALVEATLSNTLLQLPEEPGGFHDDPNAVCLAVSHARQLPSAEVLRDLTLAVHDHDIPVGNLFLPSCGVMPLLTLATRGVVDAGIVEHAEAVWGAALDSLVDLTPAHGLSGGPLETLLGAIHERINRILTLRVTVFMRPLGPDGQHTLEEATYTVSLHVVMWASIGALVHHVLTRPSAHYDPDTDFDVSVDGHVVPCKATTVFEVLLTMSTLFAPVRKLIQSRHTEQGSQSQAAIAAWRSTLARSLAVLNGVHQLTLHQKAPGEVMPPGEWERGFFVAPSEGFLTRFPREKCDRGPLSPAAHMLLAFLREAPHLAGPTVLERLSRCLLEEQRCLTLAHFFPSLAGSGIQDHTECVATAVLRAYPAMFPIAVRVKYIQNLSGHDYFPRLHFAAMQKSALGFDMKRSAVVRRDHIAVDALNVLRRTGTCAFPLDIQFEGEVGTGSGVTTEFYTLAAMGLADPDLGLWRETTDNASLFPAPCGRAGGSKWWYVVGVLMARALRERRVLPIRFHKAFLTMIVGQTVDVAQTLASIDRELDESLKAIDGMGEDIDGVAALTLDFTSGGVELVPGGTAIAVTAANVTAYTRLLREYIVVKGVQPAVALTVRGFHDVLGAEYLHLFSADELITLLCGDPSAVLWATEADVWADVVTGHGYDASSPQVEALVRCVAAFPADLQRQFLMFVSGGREKPTGGMRPKMTIVRKDVEGDSDATLPTVNTCFHYLKIPTYSTPAILRTKLLCAITHGMHGFLLS